MPSAAFFCRSGLAVTATSNQVRDVPLHLVAVNAYPQPGNAELSCILLIHHLPLGQTLEQNRPTRPKFVACSQRFSGGALRGGASELRRTSQKRGTQRPLLQH